jgi:hypothetical protein
MLRFKMFVGNASDVEGAVNNWLAEYEPEITHMAQTADGGSVVISIVFDESFRAQERRLSEERGMSNSSGPPVPAESIPDKPIVVPQEPGYYSPPERK